MAITNVDNLKTNGAVNALINNLQRNNNIDISRIQETNNESKLRNIYRNYHIYIFYVGAKESENNNPCDTLYWRC